MIIITALDVGEKFKRRMSLFHFIVMSLINEVKNKRRKKKNENFK